MDGQRIGFSKSAVRILTKYLSALILRIRFLIAWFDEKHQALHDKLASMLVIESSPSRYVSSRLEARSVQAVRSRQGRLSDNKPIIRH